MMILTDLYLAFALLLVAGAGLLIVWQLGQRPADRSLLKIAAVMLVAAGLIAGISLAYYGRHLLSPGECPYADPLAPCPAGNHGHGSVAP
jgi:disulfide bond formation protein DsbB